MFRLYLRRQVHTSWLLAFVCVGIFFGVVWTQSLPLGSFYALSWLLTGSGLVLWALWRGRVWAIAFAIFGGLLIGLWRGSAERTGLATYQQTYGVTAVVQGTLSDDVDINKRDQLVVRLKHISINNVALKGSLWLTTEQTKEIQRSDKLTVKGKIQKGFGGFAASMYDAKVIRVQRPEPGDVALKIRDWFSRGVTSAVSEPEASLGLGYLVGQRRGLPEEFDTALKTAGLTHIVVASGYNLTILVRLTRRLFEKISKYLSFVAASGMIASFVAITGMSPSMSRAGLVAGLSLLAWYYGRRFHPLVLLPLAIAITILVQPSYAWGDLGWQLSFAAFAGVMLLAPLANAYFFGDKPERPLARILVETLSAQICTLPIILLAFGQTSAVAPIANMLVLPLVPLAMVLTFIAGISGMLLPSAANVVGLPAELLLTYMTSIVNYFGTLPWAIQEISLSFTGACVLTLVIVAFGVYMWRKTGYKLANASLVE